MRNFIKTFILLIVFCRMAYAETDVLTISAEKDKEGVITISIKCAVEMASGVVNHIEDIKEKLKNLSRTGSGNLVKLKITGHFTADELGKIILYSGSRSDVNYEIGSITYVRN